MNEDDIVRALILRIEPGDILLLEVKDGFDLDSASQFFHIFEERGIPVLVHGATIKEFRIARRSYPEEAKT